jgi:transcription antitermination factor NusG
MAKTTRKGLNEFMMETADRPFAAEGPAWYALHTRNQHEALVESDLRTRGLEVLVPRITVRSRRRDRFKLLEIPLFSCYMFVYTKMNIKNYNAIVRHRVVCIVRTKRYCILVPAETISSIRSMVECGKAVYPWPGLAPGRRVRVVAGSLAGVTGTLRRKSGKRYLAVGVELIGQSVAVELDKEVNLVS